MNIDGEFDDWAQVLNDPDNNVIADDRILSVAWTHDAEKLYWLVEMRDLSPNEQSLLFYIDRDNNGFLENNDGIFKIDFKRGYQEYYTQYYTYSPKKAHGDSLINNTLPPPGDYGIIKSLKHNFFLESVGNMIEIALPYDLLGTDPTDLLGMKVAYAASGNIPRSITSTVYIPTEELYPTVAFEGLAPKDINNKPYITVTNTGDFTLPPTELRFESNNPNLANQLHLLSTSIPALLPQTSHNIPIPPPLSLTDQENPQTLSLIWTHPHTKHLYTYTIQLAAVPIWRWEFLLIILGITIIALIWQFSYKTVYSLYETYQLYWQTWLYLPTAIVATLIVYAAIINSGIINAITTMQAESVAFLLNRLTPNIVYAGHHAITFANEHTITLFAVTSACAALLETLLFMAIFIAYPHFTNRYRLHSLILGTSAIQILNCIRITLIILVVYTFDFSFITIAHNVIANGFFYCMLFVVFYYAIMRKTLKQPQPSR